MKKKNVPSVLLLGNGINRAFGVDSWTNIIENLSTGEFDSNKALMEQIKQIPNSLQTIVVSSDAVSDGMNQLADSMMPSPISVKHREMLLELVDLPFDAILTTNYSYEIEVAIDPEFYVEKNSKSKYRVSANKGTKLQEQFGIFKYNEVEGKRIWHVHGEASRPKSMVMGHYYYGKLLGEIQKRVPNTIREYKIAEKRGLEFNPKSWVDYFLMGNVYMLGFGLDPSEMDIWWLLNCRKRNKLADVDTFLYEPNLDMDKRCAIRVLAEIFGIQHDHERVRSKNKYVEYYDNAIKDIGRKMEKQTKRV